jgi:hypothetical protein
MMIGEYENAIKSFEEFKDYSPQDPLTPRIIEACMELNSQEVKQVPPILHVKAQSDQWVAIRPS